MAIAILAMLKTDWLIDCSSACPLWSRDYWWVDLQCLVTRDVIQSIPHAHATHTDVYWYLSVLFLSSSCSMPLQQRCRFHDFTPQFTITCRFFTSMYFNSVPLTDNFIHACLCVIIVISLRSDSDCNKDTTHSLTCDVLSDWWSSWRTVCSLRTLPSVTLAAGTSAPSVLSTSAGTDAGTEGSSLMSSKTRTRFHIVLQALFMHVI